MSKSEAHFILDCARAGADISTAEINRALIETGDLNEWDECLHIIRPAGTWEGKTGAPAGHWDGLYA